MADPLEILRRPLVPLDPDPSFAGRLRGRLALALAEGEPMTVVATEPILVPYLAVHDARAALEWYVDALGAEVVGEPVVMPDGRIGHAELRVFGATVYLSDDHPELDVIGPVGRGGTTVTLHLTVPSADATVDAAVRHGARLERAPAEEPYGRTGVVRDPFGHRWMIQSPVGNAVVNRSPAVGDVAYFSLHVPSGERARRFYSDVLGWRFGDTDEPGHADQVVNLSLPAGVWSGPDLPGVGKPGVLLVHRVDDLRAALASVRALGGTAAEPRRESYGVMADCTDDQGNGFSLLEMPADTPRPPINGALPGDVSYITVSPGDERRAADFYSELFGWRFAPGNVDRGLQVEGPQPMTGFWGGPGRPAVVLMYRVADIDTAVARVRALGGRATQPEQQPYGITAECVDDQGMAFYLGQH
jgi:predicted enzyme related to lactoylglutathione lyase